MSRAVEPDPFERRLSGPGRLTFPEDWEMGRSWRRAVRSTKKISPVNAAEWMVVVGYPDETKVARYHRVTFAISEGDVVAECDCDGHRFRGWCAHIAACWWAWVRAKLYVTDLRTDTQYQSPPSWVRVEEEGQR